MFQFTLPRGERLPAPPRKGLLGGVSIHAPAGGATSLRLRSAIDRSFQFTLPRGERLPRRRRRARLRGFQFTLPRGERPAFGRARRDLPRFNSRSRGGSDRAVKTRPSSAPQFQFTLPRGERLRGTHFTSHNRLFQFTLPRGERQSLVAPTGKANQVSIHAPAGGATDSKSCAKCQISSFNSRSRGGSDWTFLRPRKRRGGFNSRSRGGSDWRICRTPKPF